MNFNEWSGSIFNKDDRQAWYTKYEIAKEAWDYQQAKIDALMLEYCPEEMTKEQLEEWSKNQKASDEINGI